MNRKIQNTPKCDCGRCLPIPPCPPPRPPKPPAPPKPPRTVNTRIALREDEIGIWERTNPALYPGEIAISYRIENGIKLDFRMKAGALGADGRMLKWCDLPWIGGLSDSELQARIQAEVQRQLAGMTVNIEQLEQNVEDEQQLVLNCGNSTETLTDDDIVGG